MVMVPPPQRNANIKIGDYVPRAGIYTNPGIVVDKKETGELVVDTDPESIKKYHRHSFTNGLDIEEKDRFNAIMDDVMNITSNGDKINSLQAVIDDLKNDANSLRVVSALKNEQSELIRLSRELPRVYVVDADKIR